MTTTIQELVNSNRLLATIAAAFLFAGLPSVSIADRWELRTTPDEVPGTREIESGKIEKAIRVSKVRLRNASQLEKVAVLTNLCIGYILSEDFDEAENYCDQAVERPNQKTVSYNNRGVLKALQGDYAGAMQDFDTAANSGCFNDCSSAVNVPSDLPRPVARRNLGRAEYQAEAVNGAAESQIAAR